MSSMAVEGLATSQETGPEQSPESPRLALAEPQAEPQVEPPAEPQVEPPAEPQAVARPDRLRPLEAAQCCLCGVALPLGLLVPDGGQACADIRWYCKDARSCTERWTTAARPGQQG